MRFGPVIDIAGSIAGPAFHSFFVARLDEDEGRIRQAMAFEPLAAIAAIAFTEDRARIRRLESTDAIVREMAQSRRGLLGGRLVLSARAGGGWGRAFMEPPRLPWRGTASEAKGGAVLWRHSMTTRPDVHRSWPTSQPHNSQKTAHGLAQSLAIC